jgi:hypothetical protein
MSLNDRELWGLIHGMGLGALFLLAFGGGLAGLWSLRPRLVTPEGVAERVPRLKMGMGVMAVAAWLTVLTGTWIVYPWYREGATEVCEGVALADLPEECGAKFELLAQTDKAEWHEFAMEWKEHVAWIVPFLATAVLFAVLYLGRDLVNRDTIRVGLMWFMFVAFVLAAIAGLLGALITKNAPVL